MNQLDIKKNFYKFKTFEKQHYILNYWIDSINFHYNTYNFTQIHIIFDQINTSPFLTIDDKKYIFNTYYSNLVLKRIIEKIKIRYKNYKKSKDSVNNKLLNLTDINIETCQNYTKFNYYIDLSTPNKKQFYRFNVYEIIKLFQTSLLNQYYGIPDPSIPIHPYIGTEFTISQIIFIFSHLTKFDLPLELHLFKSSSYNIDKLLENHRNYFLYKSSSQYVIELNDNDWLNLLTEWYKKCNIKKIACWKCLNELSNLRSIIQSIIIHYIYESNNSDISIKSNEMILKFSKNFNLEPSYKHPIKHIKISKKSFVFTDPINNSQSKDIDFIKEKKKSPNTQVFIFNANNKSKSIIKKKKNFKKKIYNNKIFKTFDLFKNNYKLSPNMNTTSIETNTHLLGEFFDIPAINFEENTVMENQFSNTNEIINLQNDSFNTNEILDLQNESFNTTEMLDLENEYSNTLETINLLNESFITTEILDLENESSNTSDTINLQNEFSYTTPTTNLQNESSNTTETINLQNESSNTTEIINLQNDIDENIEQNVSNAIQTNEITEVIEDIENFNLIISPRNSNFQLLYNLYIKIIIRKIKKFENINKNREYADIIKKNDIPIYSKLWNGNLLWIDKKNHKIYNPSPNQLQIIGKLYMQKLIGCPEDNVYNFITKIDSNGIWNIDTDQPEFKEPEIDN